MYQKVYFLKSRSMKILIFCALGAISSPWLKIKYIHIYVFLLHNSELFWPFLKKNSCNFVNLYIDTYVIKEDLMTFSLYFYLLQKLTKTLITITKTPYYMQLIYFSIEIATWNLFSNFDGDNQTWIERVRRSISKNSRFFFGSTVNKCLSSSSKFFRTFITL